MELKKIMINMALLGLFVFALFAFIITTQSDNNVAVPITNNSLINTTYGDLENEITSSQREVQSSMNTFGNTTPAQQFGELEVNSIISPTRTARAMTLGFFNIIIRLPMIILGVSPIVSYIISALLGILIIIGIWAIWKGAIS